MYGAGESWWGKGITHIFVIYLGGSRTFSNGIGEVVEIFARHMKTPLLNLVINDMSLIKEI